MKWSGLFLESFMGLILSENKVQWLDLSLCLWSPLIELSFAKTIWTHYDYMVKYYKPCLSSSSKNYYWFVQYMDNDNGDWCAPKLFNGFKHESNWKQQKSKESGHVP